MKFSLIKDNGAITRAPFDGSLQNLVPLSMQQRIPESSLYPLFTGYTRQQRFYHPIRGAIFSQTWHRLCIAL